VAILTLLVNATTTELLLRILKLTKESEGQQRIFERTRTHLLEFTKHRALLLSRDKLFSTCNWDQVGQASLWGAAWEVECDILTRVAA
jgi:hypothetical protein